MLILPIYFGTCYTAENENDYNDFNNFPNLTVAVLSHVGGKKLYFSPYISEFNLATIFCNS